MNTFDNDNHTKTSEGESPRSEHSAQQRVSNDCTASGPAASNIMHNILKSTDEDELNDAS